MSKFEQRQQAVSNGSHALVIGSGIAGLLAARVLLNHFKYVTVVERDLLPEQPGARSGVPQTLHSHGMLKRGNKILEQLFPGLEAESIAAGAIPLDEIADTLCLNQWGCLPRCPSDLIIPNCSRSLLEWLIRRRLAASDRAASPQGNSRLLFLDATQVQQLLTDEGNSRVIGLRLCDLQGRVSGEHNDLQLGELTANLVVDASGRNSPLPKWLEELGYPAPPETKVNANLGYTTRWYERPQQFHPDWKILSAMPQPPDKSRCGVIVPMEGERWVVSLYGFNRDYPPTDEVGFLEFARTINPAIYEALQDAKPLSPVYSFRATENRLRHYEKSQLPEALVVMGDAVFAFNPYYGQGMTAAALGALDLDRCLDRPFRSRTDLTGLSDRFQKRLAQSLQTFWAIATFSDHEWLNAGEATATHPKRNWIDRLVGKYWQEVLVLSERCPESYRALREIYHMVKSPIVIYQPRIIAKVIEQVWQKKTKSADLHSDPAITQV
jgi:2-polyprenyl-6-methoxyphenol hydroxylase-like FAD-dependent oxidoreductase